MKSKIILCLALVLSGIFAKESLCAYEVEIQLNHSNLKTNFSFLEIKTVHISYTNNEVVAFTVLVIQTNKSENITGCLEVRETNSKGSNNYIVYTSVQGQKLTGGSIIDGIPEPLRSKCVVFHFSVAAKYLETSAFRIEETAGKFGSSPVDYCFNLKEFADEK